MLLISNNLFMLKKLECHTMARIGVQKGNIRRLSISVSEKTADWIEAQVESQRYRNISHTIESVIREKMANI
jgi:hypothetical protein